MAFYKLFSKSPIISNALKKVVAEEKEERIRKLKESKLEIDKK
jgi:hypothetical protein